jgi:hypothetical protein
MIAAAALSVLLAQASPQPTTSPSATPTVSSSPSPTSKPTLLRIASGVIAIPTNWQAAPDTITAVAQQGIIGSWMSGSGSGETLVLFGTPRHGVSLDAIVKRTQARIAHSATGAALKNSTAQTFCRGTHGWKLTYSDSSGNGETFMIALTRARAYFLSYQYPGYPGVSAEGEGAAESLCPPADPVVHLPPPPISIPSGWTLQDPTSFGLPEGTTEWVWLPPAGTTQGLEVNAVPRSALYTLGPYGSLMSILESYDRTRLEKAFMALRIVSNEPMRICGKFDGSYRRLVMAAKNGEVALEWIATVTQSARYNAIYWHYTTTAADARAEQAIRSLCPSN